MPEFLPSFIQAFFIIALAPLSIGITKKTKALLQNRFGASILQPYFDLFKWWHKEIIYSIILE